METSRTFEPSDRYRFDFGECSPSKGFAQVDTSQDAPYFGTWANPTTLQIVSYTEGDVCRMTAGTADEFVEELMSIKAWNEKSGYRFGIDPGCDHTNPCATRFKALGLGDLLH